MTRPVAAHLALAALALAAACVGCTKDPRILPADGGADDQPRPQGQGGASTGTDAAPGDLATPVDSAANGGGIGPIGGGGMGGAVGGGGGGGSGVDPVDGGADQLGPPAPDGAAGCADGDLRACSCGAEGATGTKTCAAGSWGPCTAPCAASGLMGKCAGGTQICDAHGAWTTCSIAPAAADSCAPGNDDNCNGIKNEGCGCVAGETRTCDKGGLFGRCATGTETCAGGTWGACSITPAAADSCAPGNDDTCNGVVNEGCACVAGATRPCKDGGLFGKCAAGTQTCGDASKWSACSITPAAADSCAPGNDDSCNGIPDEGCACVEGQTRTCSQGGLFGKCAGGTQTCGAGGKWGTCSIQPATSDGCVEGNDDNCNGRPNEGCACIAGRARSCGDAGAKGTCAAGSQTCDASGKWATCSVAPKAADSCEPGNDDSCNGISNEGCACTHGQVRTCAAAGIKGTCAGGSETCGTNGQWGACSIAPKLADSCEPGNDDTCNGAPNEGCACTRGQSRTCAAGGLRGPCAGGTETCGAAGVWSACSIAPKSADACQDGNDDNCNGTPNEGCACIDGRSQSCGECGNTQTCSNGQWSACATCCPVAVADRWKNIALGYASTPWRIVWPPESASAAKPTVDATSPGALVLPRDSIVDRDPVYPGSYIVSFNVNMFQDNFALQTGLSGILDVFPALRREPAQPFTIGGLRYGRTEAWQSYGGWINQNIGTTSARVTIYVRAGASQLAALLDSTGSLIPSGFQPTSSAIGAASFLQLIGSNLPQYDESTRTVKVYDLTGCAGLTDAQVQRLYDARKEY